MSSADSPVVLTPQLCQRYASLIWYFLDANLHKSALFYAEQYFMLDYKNHDARHLYATALLEAGQLHSAHRFVNIPQDVRCTGCVDILAKCCAKLGRHRLAREAIEACLRDHDYTPTRTCILVKLIYASRSPPIRGLRSHRVYEHAHSKVFP